MPAMKNPSANQRTDSNPRPGRLIPEFNKKVASFVMEELPVIPRVAFLPFPTVFVHLRRAFGLYSGKPSPASFPNRLIEPRQERVLHNGSDSST